MRRLVIIAASILGVLVVGLIAAAIWFYTPDRPRAELEAKYAGPPSFFVEVLGARVHLRDTGPRDALAMVLLHGFGASLQTWDGLAHLMDPAYRMIRLDLPGFGLSEPDPTGDYSDERSMAVIAGVMDTLGVEKAVLVGNSMGGRIAWRFAAEYSARVLRLVLIAPDGFASPGMEYGKAPSVPFVARVLPYILPVSMLRASMAPAYADPAMVTETLIERYHDLMLAPGVRRAILKRMEQYILVDPVPILPRIALPTLLIWGEKDAMVPFTNAADYQRLLPDSRLASFPDLGHVPQEEAPARLAGTLQGFLSQ